MRSALSGPDCGDVRQIDFKAATNSLKKAILLIYFIGLLILLVLETVTVLTGNRSFLTS